MVGDASRQPAVWTALVTPMLSSGAVDYSGLATLLQRQEDAGCGVVLLGSTGEGLALSGREQREVIHFATRLGLKIPLLAGVGGFRLTDQLAWLAFCADYDLDGYLLVTPLYSKPGLQGQLAWFSHLLAEATRPCMIYNVPSRTGASIDPKILAELAEYPRCWALKEASGSLAYFRECYQAAPALVFYSGEDKLFERLVPLGASGVVSVVANLWPHESHCYVRRCLAGKLDEHGDYVWQLAAQACFAAVNPVPVKVWLAECGIIASATLRLPLMAAELTAVHQLAIADFAISSWYQSLHRDEA